MAVKNIILKNADGDYVIPYVGIPSQTGNAGKVLGTNGESLDFVEKQDTISDLAAIRSGATLGATSVQPGDLATKQDQLTSANAGKDISITEETSGEEETKNGISPISLEGVTELNYIKALGATEQRNLPSEYTQLEYIESTGTQYINTGMPVSNDLTFGYKASPKLANQLSISQLRPSPAGRSGLIVWQSGGDTNIRYISDGSQFTTSARVHYTLGRVFNIIFNDNNKFYIDGSLVYTKTNTIDTLGVLVTGVDDRVYSLWAKIDGVLVFNGIPCRRNSDSVLGMYDTVSKTFLTNAGTGTFTAGADVTTPTPDTPIDIVCNNGVVKVNSQGQIYTDGTVETVNVHGKNLFDVNNYIEATIATDGTITQNNYNNLYIMKVAPNNSYIFNYSPTGTIVLGNCIYGYTKELPTIGGTATYNVITIGQIKNKVFTVPDGYHYLVIRLNKTSFVPKMTDIQLEQGSTATTYQPYFDGGSLECPMLLSVGGYQDEFILEN